MQSTSHETVGGGPTLAATSPHRPEQGWGAGGVHAENHVSRDCMQRRAVAVGRGGDLKPCPVGEPQPHNQEKK